MILQHLAFNPQAKDTLEGIRKWWLDASRQEPRIDELEVVLDELMLQGWVIKLKPEGSKPVYGLNRERLQQVQDAWQIAVK